MNWDDLRIFLEVARGGQIARAAPRLGLDATTVGRRLRRLEKSLGQVLFEQQRDGQRLTAAGERLMLRAENMDRSMQQIQGSELGASRPEGLVRASASEGLGSWFIAPNLPAFADAYPGVTVDLAASTGFLNPTKRETDLAILLARPRRGPLIVRKLTDYGLRLYATPGYLAAHPPIETTADLRGQHLVGYVTDLLYAPELRYLDELDLDIEPRLRSTSISAQHRITRAGGGVAVLPCFMGDADAALVRVLPAVRIERSFWLVMHQDTRALPRIRAFTDWLTHLIEQQQPLLTGL
ncbi:MAG: LysR family transcriptional regulator [Sphingobium sp.]